VALSDPAGEASGAARKGVSEFGLSAPGEFVVSGRWTSCPLNLCCQGLVLTLGECITSVLARVPAGRVQLLKVCCHLCSGSESMDIFLHAR